MNLENNYYVVGVLVDFEIKEWAQGKFNRTLVINQPYVDKHQNENAQYTNLNVHPDDLSAMQAFARDNRGLRVMVPFRVNLKSGTSQRGSQYAFNEFYLPKGTKPQVLTSQPAKAS